MDLRFWPNNQISFIKHEFQCQPKCFTVCHISKHCSSNTEKCLTFLQTKIRITAKFPHLNNENRRVLGVAIYSLLFYNRYSLGQWRYDRKFSWLGVLTSKKCFPSFSKTLLGATMFCDVVKRSKTLVVKEILSICLTYRSEVNFISPAKSLWFVGKFRIG